MFDLSFVFIGYELSYGSAPANYSIHGQPGGLARIDKILGLNLYGTTFGNSPLVFGAFPSLHSGCATIEMLFLGWLFPKARPYCLFHVMWMWFATMYLTHHYLIDLVGGSIYALLAFFSFHRRLPHWRYDCLTRLDYIVDVPVKRTVMNFVRSIEMEKFLTSIHAHLSNDPETAAKMIPVGSEEEIQDDAYNEIPLHAYNNNYPLLYSGPSTTTTSPISSGPPSPLTPHSTTFSHFELKRITTTTTLNT